MIAVESFKDESKKPHKCPEEIKEDAELKIPKNVNNKNNVCELFYDTRSVNECDKENDGNNALDDTDVAGKNMIRRKSHDTAANGGLCYTDQKNVTACDLPEIVVCYKESSYHVVKDICVDEGVPVHEKFLFGQKDSVRCNSNSDQCEETKSPEDRNNGKVDDPKTKQDVEESSREGFADSESSSSCNQEHLIVTREAKEEVVTTSENVLETTALKTEEPRKTEEILSSVSTTTPQEPNILVGGSFEDDKVFSSGFGETSFSAGEAVSISGHISYSGPVVVSGRLSVRSDGSTTSGRSFAFPIQNGPVVLKEWLKLRREDSKDGERSSSVVDSLDQLLGKRLFTFEAAQRSKKGL